MLLPHKIEMTRGRHLPINTPVFSVANQKLRTVDFLRHLPDCFHWKLIKVTDSGFIMTHYGDTLELTTEYFNVMFAEWRLWLKYYLPPFSLREKVVLDIGSGCGETVHLYHLKGARTVIAIEPDALAVDLLRKNARTNNWRVEILEEKFSLSHLDLPHDFMKMDIETNEALLLRLPESCLKPCVIEAHSDELIRRLKTKFRMRILYKMAPGIALLGN